MKETPGIFKRFWLVLALLLALAIVGLGLWSLKPAQIVTLPNGDQYRFAGVTFGTSHEPPSMEARLLKGLPKRLAVPLRKYWALRLTQFNEGSSFSTPQYYVWFQRLGPIASSGSTNTILAARLANAAGAEGGVTSHFAFAPNIAWSCASFPVMPRRTQRIEANLYQGQGPGKAPRLVGAVHFRNPSYGRFPEWQADSLPNVKEAGDLKVRLDEVRVDIADYSLPRPRINGPTTWPFRPPRRGEDARTDVSYSFLPLEATNHPWALRSVAVADATGNALRPVLMTFVPGTLWSDEAAWRVTLEFKCTADFPPDELVTFKNVPIPEVGATGFAPITTMVQGMPIVLTKFQHNPNMTAGATRNALPSRITVELPDKPAGVVVDFLEMNTDAGKAVSDGDFGLDFGDVLTLRYIPTNARTAEITWIVQRPRSVEFMVKPPAPID